MSENPTLTIPKDVIQPIIEAKINEAIIQALNGSQAIMAEAIAKILDTKVDITGKVTSYVRSDSKSWLTWAVGMAVRKAAQAAITEAIGGHEKLIRDCLVEQLKKRNSPMVRDLIKSLTMGISTAAENKYRLQVTVDD